MRSFLVYLALTCAVALVTPAFWWLLANRTGVTVGEAVEADHRAIKGGKVNCAHGITVLSFKATVGGENHPV